MRRFSILLLLTGCSSPFDFAETAVADGGGGSGGQIAAGGQGGGDGGSQTGGGGSSGGAGGSIAVSCPGDGMALVPKPAGGWSCIDRTEVTRNAYAPFAASSPAQTGVCAWNTTFVPDVSGLCQGLWPPGSDGEQPVVCIDWCDAEGYCAAAGKRLCDTTSIGDFDDPWSSEWFNACSRGGVYQFPYGDIYDPTACNGGDTGLPEGLVDVGSFLACEGGYSGIWDMSGNAWEWIGNGACSTSLGAGDVCVAAGGASYAGQSALRCRTLSAPTDFTRSSRQHRLGFRCCADAVSP
jgi:formylglycine-generating enzyme required for sulfatase activity